MRQQGSASQPSSARRDDEQTTSSRRHPALELDETVHQRTRLGVLAILYSTDFAEFGYLKQALELTDGNLDRHLVVLSKAGYVTSSKKGPGRARTTVAITEAGREAFAAEMSQLEQLTETVHARRR